MTGSHPRHPSPASRTWTTRDTQNGAHAYLQQFKHCPSRSWQGCSQEHHTDISTQPPAPFPFQGWGSCESSSPHTQMRLPEPGSQHRPRSQHPPRRREDVPKPAPQHSFLCQKQDRQNTQGCPCQPRGAPSQGCWVAPGPVLPSPPSPAPITFFLLCGKILPGQACGSHNRHCHGIVPQRHPLT